MRRFHNFWLDPPNLAGREPRHTESHRSPITNTFYEQRKLWLQSDFHILIIPHTSPLVEGQTGLYANSFNSGHFLRPFPSKFPPLLQRALRRASAFDSSPGRHRQTLPSHPNWGKVNHALLRGSVELGPTCFCSVDLFQSSLARTRYRRGNAWVGRGESEVSRYRH